jgi:hypothetical protein
MVSKMLADSRGRGAAENDGDYGTAPQGDPIDMAKVICSAT